MKGENRTHYDVKEKEQNERRDNDLV